MGFASSYLSKHSLFPDFIDAEPIRGTSLIVVIPCFNEPDVLTSVESLFVADRPSFPVEVIIVVNSPENSTQDVILQNRNTVAQIMSWSKKYCNDHFTVHVIDAPAFPKKHAGAGLARKAGMDEALSRFNRLGNDNGIIVSFDADSICDRNYFTELENCFSSQEITGCNIYFEHPLFGRDESSAVYRAITGYELYLRYFVQAMRMAGFPYAYHTVGSCFAVNAKIYALQGGMNRKTAGEDFYFLNKIFPLGNFTELNTTRVIPSSRISGRVPFGTGATMKKIVSGDLPELQTYPLESFDELFAFFSVLPGLFRAGEESVRKTLNSLPRCIGSYILNNGIVDIISQVNQNSSGYHTFKKRFFVWFNALRLLKFLNYARDNCRDNKPVSQNAADLLERLGSYSEATTGKLLCTYRKIQRDTVWKH